MIIQFGWDLKINQSVTNVQNKLQELKKKKKLVEALYFECRFLRHIGMSKSNLQNNDYTVLCVGVTVMCLGKVHIFQHLHTFIGEGGFPGGLSFPDISVGKESTCHAGVSGSIPGSGRSPGEGIGCPLQYSCLENPMDYTVHAVTKSRTQRPDFHFPGGPAVENLPAGQKTWVPSLGGEDPLEEGMAAHPSLLAWSIPWTEERGGLPSCMGSQKSQT